MHDTAWVFESTELLSDRQIHVDWQSIKKNYEL